MSTLKVASINNEAAVSGGLSISPAGLVSGAGLDLITAQSFTAVSSLSVNNCFDADYENYRIVLHCSQSATNTTRLRLRAAGVDDTASIYTYAVGQFIPGWGTLENATSTSGCVGYCSAAAYEVAAMDIFKPAVAVPTFILSDGSYGLRLTGQTYHSAATAFDGFTLYPASGTFTGNLRVYGYRN